MVVHDPSGRKLIWSIIEDISERKRMERMKNEFVSTVSHELRTPLTAITGALGLIVGGALGTLPEQAGQMVALAHKNSQRLTHLINDLLDMEKLMAGKLRFDLQPQPLMPLIDVAMRDIQAYADQYGVRLDLTERVDAAVVEVDALRLQQVLANLLSNAAKFSPPGSRVAVRASLHGEQVRVAVIDRGPGVPAAFRDRIFQKFSQADASDTRQRGGSGLGLAISRELMEHMGGSLGFESVEGEGATFYFELSVCPVGQVVGDGA
jgi:signal transduction histidine kinase